ncbi:MULTISPECIES: NtaA/DmoA family FMN-dependent monooxygenase [Bacteria]
MKQIKLGVFEFATPKPTWAHPRATSHRYGELDYWIEYAQKMDAAGFDFLLFADGYGFTTVDGKLSDAAVKQGFAGSDAMLMIPALAHATRDLGFVVTYPTGRDHPIQTARRFAALDQLTHGRIAWNIVTGAAQDSVASLFGDAVMVPHDERYRRAREYVDLALKYWEGCWEDGAVVEDRESGMHADPAKLHRVEHEGTFYRSSGYLSVAPTPQRTPLLFQAGTSPAGKAFAAGYAECVLVQAMSAEQVTEAVADIRARADAAGRDPARIKIVVGITVNVAPTREEALRLRSDYEALTSDEDVATVYKHRTGIDLLGLDPDQPLTQVPAELLKTELGQTNVDRFLPRDGESGPTVREILVELKNPGFGMAGDPADIADRIEELIDRTDLDGVLIRPVFGLQEVDAFAEFVMPELRRRGRLPQFPLEAASLRERMLEAGPRISDDHMGAPFRVETAAAGH